MQPTYKTKFQGEDISFYHTYSEKNDSSRFLPHYHEKCEIIYFLSGDVTYSVEGRTYKLKRGDIVISRPRQLHLILPAEKTTYERYVAIINHKKIPDSIWQKLRIGKDVFTYSGNERILELFSKLDYYYGKFDDAEYERLAFNAVEEAMFNLTLSSGEEIRADINPIIAKALEYIQTNLPTISGIEEICSELYITKSHLHHLFNEYLQITPAKYIATKRLMLAQRKIRKGGKPTEIFTECGFSDYATFFRNFKRHFGYSPTYEGKIKIEDEILT